MSQLTASGKKYHGSKQTIFDSNEGTLVAERVANITARFIDYRLNQLGVRVWPDACQLVSKSAGEWQVMGPVIPLPVSVPRNLEELMGAWADPIRVTAYQYLKECPETDIAEVLLRQKPFETALQESEACLRAS